MKALSVAALAALVALSPRASADDAVRACIAASTEGQTLRDAGKLLAARDQMLACARDACPSIVRSQCAKWLAEIDARTPSVVVRAERAEGVDAVDARLSIDGRPEALDGQPVRLDPGQHTVVVEDERGGREAERVLLVEGEGVRRLTLRLPGAAPQEARPEDERRIPAGVWITGGIGVVALGGATYFGLAAKSELDHLQSTCSPRCKDAQTSAGRTDALVFDVLLGAGGAAVAAALVWGLFFPTRVERARAARLGVAPVAHGVLTTLSIEY